MISLFPAIPFVRVRVHHLAAFCDSGDTILNYATIKFRISIFDCSVFSPLAKKRTRLQPIRTASEISIKIVIEPLQHTPLYQKLASKVEELYLLGMSLRAIAKSLKVNRRTVLRALQFKNKLKTQPWRQV